MCPNLSMGILLKDFSYANEYISDTQIVHVDALSRFPIMLINDDSCLLKLKATQEHDDEIHAVKEILCIKPQND